MPVLSGQFSLTEIDRVIWLEEVDRRLMLLGDLPLRLCNWVNEGILTLGSFIIAQWQKVSIN